MPTNYIVWQSWLNSNFGHKPTRERLNSSKPAIIFQSKDKELDIDHKGDEEEEDEDD